MIEDKLLKAARAGDAEALFTVGLCHYQGVGTAQNKIEALKYFEDSAGRGNTRAKYYAATMYRRGEETPKNLEKAETYYREVLEDTLFADERVRRDVCFCMAVIYARTGRREKSMALYRHLAEQGDKRARYTLGLLEGTDEKADNSWGKHIGK